MSKCAIVQKLLDDNDYKAYEDHLRRFCSQCAMTQLKNKFNRFEIFPEGPSWLRKVESLEQTEPENMEPEKKKMKKNKQDIIKRVIAPEDVDNHLAQCVISGMNENLILLEIRKHKGLDKVAARELSVELLSKHSDERKKCFLQSKQASGEQIELPKKGKVFNEKSNLPWSPFPRIGFEELPSQFKDDKQKRYLSIISSLLQTGTTRFESNNMDLKNFNALAVEERNQFAAKVIAFFKSHCENAVKPYANPLVNLSRGAHDAIHRRQKKRWQHDNSIFSSAPLKEINLEAIHYNPEDVDSVPTPTSLLIPGRNEQFCLPNLQLKCSLNIRTIGDNYPPICTYMSPIFDDEVALSLCQENLIKFAMDATTACHLMCDSFTGLDYKYAIPVNVVREMYKGDWHTCIFLDKPRIIGKVRNSCITRKLLKATMKAQFVKHNRKERAKISQRKNKKADQEVQGGEKKNEDSQTYNDPFDNIMSAITDKTDKHNKISSGTGKRYTSFGIGMHQVIIRSTPPYQATGCASKLIQGHTITAQPFQEILPSFSAMAVGSEESLWNELKKIFKQSDMSVLLRMMLEKRITDNDIHVLQVQPRINVLSSNIEEDHFTMKRLLAERTKRMKVILSSLEPLIPGRYMIINDRDNKLKILQETDEKTSDTFPTSRDYTTGAEPQHIEDVFLGFERKVPLQWQIIGFMAPGCFLSETKIIKVGAAGKKINNARRGSMANNGNNNNGKGGKGKRKSIKQNRKSSEFSMAPHNGASREPSFSPIPQDDGPPPPVL